MLSGKEVQRIAKLARITLNEKEILKFQHDLASILEYFDVLGEVDASFAEPMTHAVPMQGAKRPDEATPKNAKEAERLLAMAPETKNRYLKVPPIL